MNCAVKRSVRKKDIGCVFRDKTRRHPGRCTVSTYILQNRTQRHSRSRIGCDKESVEVMCMAFWCRDVCQHLEQTRLVWRKLFAKSLCNVFSFTKPLAHTAFLKNCHVEDTKLFHFATLQATWHSTINLWATAVNGMVKPFTEFAVQHLGMATRSKSILASTKTDSDSLVFCFHKKLSLETLFEVGMLEF